MPSNFAISSAKFILLTYSQVDKNCEHQDVSERPSTLLPGKILRMVHAIQGAKCIIGRELHQDGGKHLHVFVAFERRFSTRNSRRFDCDGHHPNIKRVGRTPWCAYDYAIKDNDVVGGELERPDERGCEQGPPKRDADWTWITDAETRDEFFERIRDRRPKELVCNISAVLKYADWQYRQDPAEYTHPEGIHFELDSFPDLTEWVWDNLGGTSAGNRQSSPDWPDRETAGDDVEDVGANSQVEQGSTGGWGQLAGPLPGLR